MHITYHLHINLSKSNVWKRSYRVSLFRKNNIDQKKKKNTFDHLR